MHEVGIIVEFSGFDHERNGWTCDSEEPALIYLESFYNFPSRALNAVLFLNKLKSAFWHR